MNLEKEFEDKIIEKRHCILRSGKHSDTYIEKTKISLYPRLYNETIRQLSLEISNRFNFDDYDCITGPAVAGILFVAPIAIELEKPIIFPEKLYHGNGGYTMNFRKSFIDYIKGKKFIIIEDIVTTGVSIKKTAEAIFNHGGIVKACFCIWNRENINEINFTNEIQYPVDFGCIANEKINVLFPIISLINKEIPSWNEYECYCKEFDSSVL